MYLKIKGLSKNWNGFSLKNISLEIKEGAYFIFLGPCGAGKTLLLSTIAGLWQPDSGNIFIKEEDITNLAPEKRNIGYLFQNNALFNHLSVKENIYYGLKYRKPDKDFVKSVLKFLDIDKAFLSRKDTINLSGGEARKVALARCMATRPRLLLLDEPLSSLDLLSHKNVMEALKALNKNLGVTILHVSHHVEAVRELAGETAVLADGSVKYKGSIDPIINNTHSELIKKFWGKEQNV